MSETTTPAVETTEATAPVEAPKAAKKKATKKAAAPKAAKKSTKKAPAKKAAVKKAAKPAEKKAKDGLRKPQVRILNALSRNSKPLTRALIAEKAPVDVAACVEYIGSADDAVRKANDVKHFPSLITLGLVKQESLDINGKDTVVYSITAAGKKALDAAK